MKGKKMSQNKVNAGEEEGTAWGGDVGGRGGEVR